jgi:tyrosyl-tRNA synthetase
MINLVEELKWRGMVQDIMPGMEAYLMKHRVSGYVGFDPTADSLHIGNMVPIMMLVHFQRAGHKPYALVGGATGRIGDPSGKDEERQLLSDEILEYNLSCQRKQLERFLDFNPGENAALIVNNYDWFRDVGFIEFLRDVGKHITINYMKAKESVKRRIEGEEGISYTEFAYQLLQGYDFLHLYREMGVRVQMGGADQWGNITTGAYLVHRILGSEHEVFAMTCPLLTGKDGKKLGKTAKGENVWLSADRTSPYQFYQYFMQSTDEDAEKMYRIFSLRPRTEIQAAIDEHLTDPGRRSLQTALATEMTERVHGPEALADAEALTRFLFARNTTPDALAALSPSQWKEVAGNSGDPKQIPRSRVQEGVNIVDLLVELQIVQSKGEAKRSIEKDNSISLNAERCADTELMVNLDQAFHGRFFQLQRGKKNRFIVEVV